MAATDTPKTRPGCSKLDEALHDMAQPLTSLQCRLEIGLLLGDEISAREALQESLLELRRVFTAVSRVRAVAEGRGQEKKVD